MRINQKYSHNSAGMRALKLIKTDYLSGLGLRIFNLPHLVLFIPSFPLGLIIKRGSN